MKDLKIVTPALLMRTSIEPYFSRIFFFVEKTLRSDWTLHTKADASYPANFISLTRRTRRDFLRAVATTEYPALANTLASSKPIPVEQPVIQTTMRVESL